MYKLNTLLEFGLICFMTQVPISTTSVGLHLTPKGPETESYYSYSE
jgi:hypothetical protein